MKGKEIQQGTTLYDLSDRDNDRRGESNACPPNNSESTSTDGKKATKRPEGSLLITEATNKTNKTSCISCDGNDRPETIHENSPDFLNKPSENLSKTEPNQNVGANIIHPPQNDAAVSEGISSAAKSANPAGKTLSETAKPELPSEHTKLFPGPAASEGVITDANGISIERKGETHYVSNISKIEYLYTIISGAGSNQRIRVVKINDTVTELHPEHLISLNKFKKLLLGKGNISFNGGTRLYQKLVNFILELDNGKTVQMLDGFGKVRSDIYHFGNEIIISGKTKPYQELIWSGDKGIKLEKTGKLRIASNAYTVEDIWTKLNDTYPDYAKIIAGFTAATLFFDSIIPVYGCFPILYITGKSGSGKTKMAEIICNLLGCDTDLFTANCDSLSTHKGVDEKNQSLNNLPLILNEVNHKWYPLLKSRFDGEGAVKAASGTKKRTLQRQVKGSTIVTSVNRPVDSQVISRSVFVETSIMARDLDKFSDFYHNRRKLSSFVLAALAMKSERLISEIKSFYATFKQEQIEPRIISNYAIIAGALSAFMAENKITGCDRDELIAFFKKEMNEAEKALNPVYHLIREIRTLIDEESDQDFMKWDDDYIYLHVKGLWQYLSPGFKDQYYRKLDAKDIKQMFANSDYIVRYGEDFTGPAGKPIISYVKKISRVTKKCVVLSRDSILSGYRGYQKLPQR